MKEVENCLQKENNGLRTNRQYQTVMIIESADVPYLNNFPADGRIRPLLTYFDGDGWHCYRPLQGTQLLDFRPVNVVTGLYLSTAAADAADVEIPLLTFLFQHFPTPETFRAFEKLYSDLENALAVLHKYPILVRHYNDDGRDISCIKVVATELEYSLFNHRSAYDLLHGIAVAFLKVHKLGTQSIPDSFRRVAEKDSHKRIAYGFSSPLSDFYENHSARFMLFRDLRDAIGHHGDSIDTIFRLPEGFGFNGATRIGRKLKEAGLWESLKPTENDIGSCFGFLALLCADIFAALDSFTVAMRASFQSLPPPTSEGNRVFARSPLLSHYHAINEYIAHPWRFAPPASSAESKV